MGDWEWNEGEIASVEHAQDRLVLVELGEKVEASTYVYKAGAGKTYARPGSAQAHTQGEVEAVGVDVGPREGVQLKGGFVWWGEKGRNIEDSRVLVHVPGAYRRVLLLLFLILFLLRIQRIREPVHAQRNLLPRRRQAFTPPTSWFHRIFVNRQVETSYAYGLANHRQRRSYSIIRTLRWRVRLPSLILPLCEMLTLT